MTRSLRNRDARRPAPGGTRGAAKAGTDAGAAARQTS